MKPADESIDLRRGVDYIGVTVNFVVYDGKGNVLLQKRSKAVRDEQGTWDVGGGAVEFGETIDEAVRREVQEELGVTAKKINFLVAFDAHRVNKGSKTHWVALSYSVLVDSDKVRINEPNKIDEIGWFTLERLPAPLHSQIMKPLQAAKEAGIIL